jgi:hypothetical protein
MTIRFCDDRGDAGFSWIVDEPMTRTSHALAAGGRVWLVDPVRHEPALERARSLGRPAAVLQLLDRHNRDCASIASELGVPHLVAPDAVPESPFEAIPVRRTARWRETALWWPEEQTLVVAEVIGTNRFFAAGYAPRHLLVGHGEGLHDDDAAEGLRRALDSARSGLPRVLLRVPALAVDAVRRRRK